MISKIFKAYDVRATYPDPLNEEAGWKVGYAIGEFFKQTNGGKPGTVLVSRDHRPSAPAMAGALIEGLRAAAMDVIDLGMCDTSFMYFAVPHVPGALGGVQTTASHNPINYIGFKISGQGAKPIGVDTGLKEIQKIAESLTSTDKPAVGKLEEMNLWPEYRKHVLKFLSPLKRPIKVYIDACNGMATKLVPEVFGDVENLTIIKENFEITDQWVHEPNPLVPENMKPTQDGVVREQADLGACFDGDADRCMVTDEKGQIIGCDHLTAWLCGHFLKQQPGSSIVYDLRSSKVVEQTIRELGGKPARSKVGHVNMKALLRETDGIFGGELSGHFYFKHNSFADSGAIAFASILSVLSESDKPISELIAPFKKYPQSGEINFEVEDKQGVMNALKEAYANDAQMIDELDGVTIDCFDNKGFWFNVRPSNTEPLLRLNAEARDDATLKALLDELTPKLGKPAEGH
ncbi:MAG: phosphomannomutase/phosphoglucomutase [Phycisphaeraceae bacterium]